MRFVSMVLLLLLVSSSLCAVVANDGLSGLPMLNVSAQGNPCNGTCWWNGEWYTASPALTADTVSVSILLPSQVPGQGAGYGMILSSWDTDSQGYGNYVQMGFGTGNDESWLASVQINHVIPFCKNFSTVWNFPNSNTPNIYFSPGDLVSMSENIASNGTYFFDFRDANGTTYEVTTPTINATTISGDFTSAGCGLGTSNPYSDYNEEFLTCNDVPAYNILFLNNTFGSNQITSGWGDVGLTLNTPCPNGIGGGNQTAVGQDSGGENVALYNLYDNLTATGSTSTNSVAPTFDNEPLGGSYVQIGLEGGTCTGGSCGMLYYSGNTADGGGASYGQLFSKISGEGDGFSPDAGPSVTAGALSYTEEMGSAGTIAYAWNRQSDYHVMVSYSPCIYPNYQSYCSSQWYGPFDTGVGMYGAGSTPAITIAPDPGGTNNVLWVAYPDVSGTIQLMYSEDAGLSWTHVTSSSGDTGRNALSISYISKANDLLVSWVGSTYGNANFATYSINNNAWSQTDTVSASTPPNVAVASVSAYIDQNGVLENMTYPFSLATWQDTYNHKVVLSLMDYRFLPSGEDAFVPSFSYRVELPETSISGYAGNEVQNLASGNNEMVFAYIPSSGTLDLLFTQF